MTKNNRVSTSGIEDALLKRDHAGVQDFVLLEDYSNIDVFIDNLRKRFKENLIYTYIGPVLVSVNPYHTLEIYTKEVAQTYKNVNFYELPPHIYAIGDAAYHQVKSEFRDQCVLISGESGSGKTEASKKILEYVATSSTHAMDVHRVKDRLLQSNPILEAFGNAKTNRNDNSSRFGKYMDVQFDYKGAPVGGIILNYLLEKSRVCHQAIGERNFHIFYQLLRGADDNLLERLELSGQVEEYFYLNQGECITVDSIDDHKDYKAVKHALDTCDFSPEDQNALFAIIASVLHLGNIGFTEDSGVAMINDRDNGACIVAKLLGCEDEALRFALLNKSIFAEGQKVSTPLNRDQAIYARDALAKGVYERVFKWLVQKLNLSLRDSKHLGTKKAVLGLLDIYGFEIFTINSFEQFCINYCNEKLQQLFIELTLKSEQDEYLREGIEWEPVEYFNNKIICDLVEAKMGIIALMDEECLRPGEPTDDTLLEKMIENLSEHPHFLTFQSADSKKRKDMTREDFLLVHYAGEVTYNIKGFLDKNNDLLHRDLKEAMSNTQNKISSACFPAEEIISMKRPPTAGNQFKTSLAELMNILLSKEPSYVRCIKPNDNKQPYIFSEEIVKHQVKYLGLMENLRVRRAGFAYRRNYEVFLQRYKSLCPATWPHYNQPAKMAVQTICEYLNYAEDEYKLGRTKIFIRFPRVLFDTEDALQQRKHGLATQIQAVYRGFHQRKLYQRMRQAVTIIAKYRRKLVAIRIAKRRKWAVQVIRRFINGFITRREQLNDDNQFFIQQMRYHFLLRILACLPLSVLDKSWPKSPDMLNDVSENLKNLNMRNLCLKYCKTMSAEKQHQFKQKVLAESLFKNRKQSYAYSIREPFVSLRLDEHHQNLLQSNFKLHIMESDETIKYAAMLTKYDRNGYKARSRALVLTDKTYYLLEEKSFKLKKSVRYSDLTGISVSSFTDGLFVLHENYDNIQSKGDDILHSDFIIEVLTQLMSAGKDYNLDSKLNIVKSQLNHRISSGKEGTVIFTSGGKHSISKTKQGQLAVVAAPLT